MCDVRPASVATKRQEGSRMADTLMSWGDDEFGQVLPAPKRRRLKKIGKRAVVTCVLGVIVGCDGCSGVHNVPGPIQFAGGGAVGGDSVLGSFVGQQDMFGEPSVEGGGCLVYQEKNNTVTCECGEDC